MRGGSASSVCCASRSSSSENSCSWMAAGSSSVSAERESRQWASAGGVARRTRPTCRQREGAELGEVLGGEVALLVAHLLRHVAADGLRQVGRHERRRALEPRPAARDARKQRRHDVLALKPAKRRRQRPRRPRAGPRPRLTGWPGAPACGRRRRPRRGSAAPPLAP